MDGLAFASDTSLGFGFTLEAAAVQKPKPKPTIKAVWNWESYPGHIWVLLFSFPTAPIVWYLILRSFF